MDKLCYSNDLQTVLPSLLRSDFGQSPSKTDLRGAFSLDWLGLALEKPKLKQPATELPGRIRVLEDSSVALVDKTLSLCGSWNYSEVRAFLINHLNVCQALIAAFPHIEEVFGKGTNVNLQVLADHEGNVNVVLNALIQTPDDVESAIDKRRQFNRRWWSSTRKIVKNLNFDIDCV